MGRRAPRTDGFEVQILSRYGHRMMHEPLSRRDPLVSLDHPSSAFDGLLVEGSAIAEVHSPDLCFSGLWPEEERLVAGTVEKRRREFTAGRHCARLALRQLGVA